MRNDGRSGDGGGQIRLRRRDLLFLPSDLTARIQRLASRKFEQGPATCGDGPADGSTWRQVQIAARDGDGAAACGYATCSRERPIHLPDGPGSLANRPRRMSEMRDGAGARDSRPYDDENGIRLPDASGDCARRARIVPDLWNG